MTDLDKFIKYKEHPTIESRNELVEQYLYMVDILIRKYLGKGVDYDDLYQVGALALVQAVERFDPDRGFEFSSFATPTILGEIKKYFRDKQWSLKVPRRLKEISSKIQEVKDELYLQYHRAPTVKEISEATGFSQEQIIEAIEGSQAYGTYSLDKTFEDAGEDGESSFLERYTGFDEKGFERVETSEIINKVMDEMNDQSRYIFRERFIYNRSQAEIAKTLGVSQMTISRAERKIIEEFKKELHK
ncbi:SigB/SigF/SigG family RNA polymerase sigma factor [Aminicella lysinilytica]|uniref:RNA polymerase sigma-37 (RpsB/SigB) subunit n=2 Tax=Aminicella lysinilytica TaxID=433323 RepID=A0A4R6QA38_9FIRM|nr:SigB/SigF/SigG family RNA polymerase sigma factor [Aminicella lysinilytica]TDP58957.1 RNA polymerase sigma-37 (RpsB/SigB) subunit [Aminicella lysinilytica]